MALACLITLVGSAASAQSTAEPPTNPLATRTGHQFNFSVQHYDYTEPDSVDISIHGIKVGAEYTGAFSLNERRHWFARFNVRGTVGNADYRGWCRPWQLVPSSASANGYRLTLGARSPCSESGDSDWYVEGRMVAGKDFIGDGWAVAPFAGIGLWHLSNGVTGNFNFRTDEYLYVPIGITMRRPSVAGRRLEVTVEYDHLLRGWQKTRNSLLGGGTVPATTSTPSFTIGDFTDLSFPQHDGWALRASAAYHLNRSWSIEPYYLRWRIEDSPVRTGSVAYTVNNITARQSLGYYEPHNVTNEFGIKVGWHLGNK
jgi:hypothetical protein